MVFAILALLLVLADQGGSVPPNRILNPTNPNPVPGDARMSQFDGEIPGTSWRVFSVTSFPDAPTIITQVEEVRQQNPPSTWATAKFASWPGKSPAPASTPTPTTCSRAASTCH